MAASYSNGAGYREGPGSQVEALSITVSPVPGSWESRGHQDKMWHAAHVNQARGAKTQETSALAWLAVRAPRQPGTSLWPCLHGHGYFIRPAWPYLIMSLMEEGEALAKIQTSSVCISLRGITICKHDKNRFFCTNREDVD